MEKEFASLPVQELVYPGHNGCPGCGAALCMRYTLKALGPKTRMVIAPGCWTILAGMYPHTSLKIPVVHCLFASCASTASGLSRGLQLRGDRETTVVAWAGDGGTFDIGIQSLSGAAEKNENILFICYDNEAYMNTGVQRSSATPFKARTTTTPAPNHKLENKKDIMQIMAAHNIPYAATATVAFPDDFIRKLKKAQSINGFKFVHLLTPCPTGWNADTAETIHLARLAVHSRIFPLLEIENGIKYTLNYFSESKVPVSDYFALQKRFQYLTSEDMHHAQQEVDKNWKLLISKMALYDMLNTHTAAKLQTIIKIK